MLTSKSEIMTVYGPAPASVTSPWHAIVSVSHALAIAEPDASKTVQAGLRKPMDCLEAPIETVSPGSAATR